MEYSCLGVFCEYLLVDEVWEGRASRAAWGIISYTAPCSEGFFEHIANYTVNNYRVHFFIVGSPVSLGWRGFSFKHCHELNRGEKPQLTG